ncbi:MAG: bifunctional folylpolyglutamate synthase/dihydrofolate synthase [Akkermansiaceae bacterium]|nr:bifunctional folylpolyglutamate synthase/dihydrofolate synthase [Verrucomicrobiales bacterium]
MTHGNHNPDYDRAVEFLYQLQWFGARLGLENTLKLAQLAGNPERGLRFIHVAGTNGKGSTCAMLESIYRAAGLRVGLFVSPHLVSFRERIQINRQMIPELEVVRLVELLQPWVGAFPESDHPTFFEAVTVMALLYFAEQKCDLVIWETGLGGRLDATNIVSPIASVITNIQYDHQKWLGSTLASIAAEKAGIIKPGIPVITGAEEPEAVAVIQQVAATQRAPLTHSHSGRAAISELTKLPLLGEHQRKNAALAVTTVEVLRNVLPVSAEQLRIGLETVHWPGRMQLHVTAAGQKILLDGAHNVGGARALAGSLKQLFPAIRPTFILGILEDKDSAAICEILGAAAARLILISVQSERTASPEQLALECQASHPSTPVVCCSSLNDALAQTTRDEFVVITGSLYLVGEAMEGFGLGEEAALNERGLNEWSQKR